MSKSLCLLLRRAAVIGVAAVAFYACAGIHQVTALPTAVLDQGNFKYVRYVEGSETSKYVFGIGGMSREARETNAYNKMMQEANLGPGQTIANVSIRKNKLLYCGGIVHTVTTVVSGWVVELLTSGAVSAEGFTPIEAMSDGPALDEPLRQAAEKNDPVEDEPIEEIIALFHSGEILKLDEEKQEKYSDILRKRIEDACDNAKTEEEYNSIVEEYQVFKDYLESSDGDNVWKKRTRNRISASMQKAYNKCREKSTLVIYGPKSKIISSVDASVSKGTSNTHNYEAGVSAIMTVSKLYRDEKIDRTMYEKNLDTISAWVEKVSMDEGNRARLLQKVTSLKTEK